MAEVAEKDGNTRDEHLGRSGVELANFYEELESDIVDEDIKRHNEHVAKELIPTLKRRLREGDVFIEPEAREQGYRESNAEGKDVGRNSQGKTEDGKIDHIAERGEENMVEAEIKHPVEHHIASAATSVAENFA